MYRDKWIKGRRIPVLTDEAQAWADHAILLTKSSIGKSGWITAKGKVAVLVWFYFPDNRKRDTHNGLKLLMDCLESAGVYENDRFALPRIMDWEVDKKSPRIEIVVQELIREVG